MRRACLGLSLAVICLGALQATARAQMVQVGPGFVQAPYARIFWNPDGSTHVRAPWVNLYTPGFRWGFRNQPVAEQPDIGQMDWQQLQTAIGRWNSQLETDLDQFKLGYTWRAHLKTDEIAALVQTRSDAPPAEEIRGQLDEIHQIYVATSESPEYRRIADLPSYQTLLSLLTEYTTPADERQRRQLYLAAAELNRSLEHFKTGEGWRRYLELADGQALSEDFDSSSPPVAGPDELAKVLARFESVEQNAEYRVIAAEPAFKAAHQRLAAYVSQAAHRQQIPEELPAPKPAQVP